MSTESRALLQSAARVVLLARGGPLADQLARIGRIRAPLPHGPPAPPAGAGKSGTPAAGA